MVENSGDSEEGGLEGGRGWAQARLIRNSPPLGFSLQSSGPLSAALSLSVLLQTGFVQAAGHMATGLSRFPAFHLVTREERSVPLSTSASKILGKGSDELRWGHALTPGSEKGREGNG